MEDIPTLPTWLSPTQIRIIPVNEGDLDYAEEIYEKIKMSGIRGDIDDRDETLGRKIRDAEMEWIPYIAVIGDREKKNRNLSVTMRKKKEREQINIGDLLRIIKSETEDLPMKRLSLPYRLSMRAKFV
ncbi:MAG: Threonine--tRNA ligase [Candidatus Methanolliviera sp. GoM_asphalt]|nr:MAG: Threonine--tRNA ligase [Candidatus Methanolliviera sp. GoM_asphalt]